MIQPFFSFKRGMNSNISPFEQPADQPSILNNCVNWYKIGALTKDTGYSIVDAVIQANKSVGGLYNFVQDSSTEKMLVAIDNSGSTATKLWYRANGAGSFTEIAAAASAWTTASHKVEMQGFMGYCFFAELPTAWSLWLGMLVIFASILVLGYKMPLYSEAKRFRSS